MSCVSRASDRPSYALPTPSSWRVGGTMDSKETIKWEDGKTYPLIMLEISSASHPFFTGKQQVLDTEGRISRFKKQYGNK
ncbi:MAG: type B 50S ribosomal protein L31 [bacterium]